MPDFSKLVTVSVVSHGHGAMVERLLAQLVDFPQVGRIVLTLNIPEQLRVPVSDKIVTLENAVPKGFGANHNAAFKCCQSDYFCVLNPDVIFLENPFENLLDCLTAHKADLVAPMTVTSGGQVEDNARRFPTVFSLAAKALGKSDGRYPVSFGDRPIKPDWVSGLFMLFRSTVFSAIRGFDERFFLYYEDVDLCARVWKAGYRILYDPSVKVIHDAQRASHKSWRFRRWHLQSLVRYLLRSGF